MIVLVLFFVLPAALFVRLIGGEGSLRVVALIVALTVPATGTVVLRLNPDLIPDRGSLRRLTPLEWTSLLLQALVLLGGAWWLAGRLAGA